MSRDYKLYLDDILDDRTVWDIVQNKILILLEQARRVLVIEDQTA